MRLRGKTYLEDRIKIPSAECVGEVVAVDFLNPGGTIPFHIAQYASSHVHKARAAGDTESFFLVCNIITPNPPYTALVVYIRVSEEDLRARASPAFRSLWSLFVSGTDAFRASRFKIIPRILDGPWYIRQAVPDKPALLGKKLDLQFFSSPADKHGYLEIDVDISTSVLARYIVALVQDYAEGLVIDMAFTVEGQEEAHLPEQVFGAVRVCRIALGEAREVDLDQEEKLL